MNFVERKLTALQTAIKMTENDLLKNYDKDVKRDLEDDLKYFKGEYEKIIQVSSTI